MQFCIPPCHPLRFMIWSIVQFEILNILLAVRLFQAHWAGRKILIKCDNEAVVSVLRSLSGGLCPEHLVCMCISGH